MRVVSIIAASILVVGLAACGGGGGPSDLNLPSTPTTAPVPTTATTTPASTTGAAIGQPFAAALVAHARVPSLAVYDTPGSAHPVRRLANPWPAARNDPSLRVPQVFLVDAQRDGWVKVLLPVLPSTDGWVRAADVTVTKVGYAIRISLALRQMTVLKQGRVLWQGPAAVGAPASPTPTGRFSVRAKLAAPNTQTAYGPYAFALSSHSQVITGFTGGDAEVAIHGTNDASVLGRAVTLGSVRISNDEITKLASVLPLGTPVDISS
jgi:lipoprotein-anchoring transpeptidase ErfK/SrfK